MTKYFFIFTMILLLISCAGGSRTKKQDKAVTIEEHFQLAYSAAERGNLDEAVEEYQKVLKATSKGEDTKEIYQAAREKLTALN